MVNENLNNFRQSITNASMLFMSGKDIYSVIIFIVINNINIIIDYILTFVKKTNFKTGNYDDMYQSTIIAQKCGTKGNLNLYNIDDNYHIINSISYYITKNNIDMLRKNIYFDNSVGENRYLPECDVWVKINDNIEISFKYTYDEAATSINKPSSDEHIRFKNYHYTIKSPNKGLVEKFIQDVVKIYDAYITQKNRQPLFFNYLRFDNDRNQHNFTKHLLKNSKNIESVFFNNKNKFKKLLEDFKDKKNFYELAGVQHRLGILMHGKPGTGKTSLIKAISNELDRNIVNINLSKITTNTELYNIIYSRKYYTEDCIHRLSFDNTIFIFEDLDACGEIVNKRESSVSLEVDDQDLNIINNVDISSKENKEMIDKIIDNNNKIITFKKQYNEIENDRLNLSGLLNIIDGVVDSPNRLIIITTNHPEKLDPALIRPGRVDIILEMNELDETSLKDMFSFYGFNNEKLFQNLHKYASKKTGAEVEQFIINNYSYRNDQEYILNEFEKLF